MTPTFYDDASAAMEASDNAERLDAAVRRIMWLGEAATACCFAARHAIATIVLSQSPDVGFIETTRLADGAYRVRAWTHSVSSLPDFDEEVDAP